MLRVYDCRAVISLAHYQFWVSFILIQREKERQEGETSLIRSAAKNEASERRAMITPALREALTKQGESP